MSGGRGASANADWVANKTIALPDLRGRALHALDDMGNSAAGRLTATYWGANGIVLGQTGGAESRTLLTANLPAYTPAGSVSISDPGHVHSMVMDTVNAFAGSTGPGVREQGSSNTDAAVTGITASFTGTAQGGTSTPFAIVPPAMLVTFYIKL